MEAEYQIFHIDFHIDIMPAKTPSLPNNDDADDDCDCCLPLAVVEVVPLHMVPPTLDGALADPGPPPLSAPMVKLQLRNMTTLATRMVLRNKHDANDENKGGRDLVMRISLDADSPSTSSSNSADKLSKDMELLSLDTTLPSPSPSSPAMQIQNNRRKYVSL